MDPMAMYKEIKSTKEAYYSILSESFSGENIEAYKGIEDNYQEQVSLITGYFRVLKLSQKIGLTEDQEGEMISAMQEPVTRMLNAYIVMDYIADYMTEEVVEEIKTGLKLGRDYEKEELKKVLTIAQYEQWLAS